MAPPMVYTVSFDGTKTAGKLQAHPLYSDMHAGGQVEAGWAPGTWSPTGDLPFDRRPSAKTRRSARGEGCPHASKGGIARRPTSGAPPPVREEPPTVTPLYKTRLCNFHRVGACRNGSSCSFAHGIEDLRPSPDFEKTSVCPIMLNRGTCDRPGCRYAHKSEELRVSSGLLKTKMCSFFINGSCVVGEACRFAHSAKELQEAMLVQKATTVAQPPVAPKPNLWHLRRSAFGSAGDLARLASLSAFQVQDLDRPASLVTKLCSSQDTVTYEGVRRSVSHEMHVVVKPAVETESILEPTAVKVPATESAGAQDDEQATATLVVRPAQVVRSKVIVQVDDDEDALPFLVVKSSVSKTTTAMNAPAKEQAVPPAVISNQSIGTSSFVRTPEEGIAPARPGRTIAAAQNVIMPKVIVDIEDF